MINLRPEEGIGRRFRYIDDEGRTLLRFDKFPDHSDVDRHYYHTPDGVFDDVEYMSL